MNPLPQRRKTPEEIAKLRESLGIHPEPSPSAPPEAPPSTPPEEPPSAPRRENPPLQVAPVDDARPLPHARSHGHTFKRSEHSPHAQVAALLASPTPILEPSGHPLPPVIPIAVPPPQQSRPIRSLKRSDHAPAPATPPASRPVPANSKLPVHRHSGLELAEVRRRDALAVLSQGAYQLPAAAHPALLTIGYLLAIGGAAAPILLDWTSRLTESYTLGTAFSSGYHLLTACALAALPIAGFICFKKTLSRHHAAFISIIVFFALVFAALHYLT